jgi:hypothetical protein
VLNVHGVHDVREMDMHTSDPLVPEHSLVKVEITIGKLKMTNAQVLIIFYQN